jgi:anti-anti-sigma factor
VGLGALPRPFSSAGLAPLGASPGAGVVAALPAAACGLAETARIARYLAGSSAGQCGPCAFGLDAIAGQLEHLAAGRACEAYGYVSAAIDARGGQVLLDVAGLRFCGASGLGAPVRMSRHAAQAGSSLHLVAPPPLLKKLIRITGLGDQLPVHRGDQAGHVQVA